VSCMGQPCHRRPLLSGATVVHFGYEVRFRRARSVHVGYEVRARRAPGGRR